MEIQSWYLSSPVNIVCDRALTYWGWLNSCLLVGSTEWIPHFILLVHTAFALPIQLYLSHQFSQIPLFNSLPLQHQKVISCLMALNDDVQYVKLRWSEETPKMLGWNWTKNCIWAWLSNSCSYHWASLPICFSEFCRAGIEFTVVRRVLTVNYCRSFKVWYTEFCSLTPLVPMAMVRKKLWRNIPWLYLQTLLHV